MIRSIQELKRIGFAVLAALAVATVPVAHAEGEGFSLTLHPYGISEADRPALEAFVADAEKRLPPLMKALLNRPIRVQFISTLDHTTEFYVPPCPGDPNPHGDASPVSQVRGMTDPLQREVWLNSVMIPEILKGPEGSKQFSCGHRNLYTVALATVLHEVSHLYDFGNFRSKSELHKLEMCELFNADPNDYPQVNNAECELLAEKRTVSITPAYLSLMGWQDEGWLRTRIRPRNQLRLRTPDPYEFENIEENFAVNMEFFLLDPEFACRRPTVHEFFASHYGWAPTFEKSCAMRTQAQLTSGVTNLNEVRVADLDPSRIYAIHYLFAAKSKTAMMSRWGHAMYRIIVCNKLRTVVGPECLQDISDHVVVSFVANFGGLSINYWKGLTGGYPSQLDLQAFFPNIVNGYTLDEYRDLISLPLRLSEEEKRRFVYRVLEMRSEYAGRYYFFTNNCATEALSFLKGIVRTDAIQFHTNYTPVGLYEDLIQMGVVDASVVADPAKAVENGYYFKSKKDDLIKHFEKIRDAGIKTPYKQMKDYINSRPAERVALYQRIIQELPDHDPKIANRFFILESHIYYLVQKQTMKNLVEEILRLQKEGPTSGDPELARLATRINEIQQELMPGNGPSKGYGIPLDADHQMTEEQKAQEEAWNKEIAELYKKISDRATERYKDDVAEVKEVGKNRSFFLAEMKKVTPAPKPLPSSVPSPAVLP